MDCRSSGACIVGVNNRHGGVICIDVPSNRATINMFEWATDGANARELYLFDKRTIGGAIK